jgi:hypothetical protein
MTAAVEPSERVMSASPAGTWLDSLRTSFDPESGKKAEPEKSPGLIARDLRSA